MAQLVRLRPVHQKVVGSIPRSGHTLRLWAPSLSPSLKSQLKKSFKEANCEASQTWDASEIPENQRQGSYIVSPCKCKDSGFWQIQKLLYLTPDSRAQQSPKRKMESLEGRGYSSKDATGTWTLSWKPGVPTTSIFCFFLKKLWKGQKAKPEKTIFCFLRKRKTFTIPTEEHWRICFS